MIDTIVRTLFMVFAGLLLCALVAVGVSYVYMTSGDDETPAAILLLELRDPVREADEALARGDFRFFGYHTGWSAATPGITCDAGYDSTVFVEFPYRGDLLGGGIWEHYWDSFHALAKAYNQRLVGSPHYPFKHICSLTDESGRKVPTPTLPAELEHVDVLRALVQSNIWLAAYEGHSTAVMALLDAGTPVNSVDLWRYTPLFHAVLGKQFDSVSILLEHGADISHEDHWRHTPLVYAARAGNLRLVKMLSGERQDDVSESLSRSRAVALGAAADLGDPDIVRYLVEVGVDLDYGQETRQSSALQKAAGRGHVSVVEILLEAGANPHLHTQTGWTAFRSALWSDHSEVLALLANAGASPTGFDEFGTRLLRQAAKKEQHDALLVLGRCPLLLEARPSAAQSQGLETALEFNDLSQLRRICLEPPEAQN